MARTFTATLALALFAAGCSNSGKLEIRSVGDANLTARAGKDQLALAAGELAIGNVGLALESYRRALRDDPASVDALIGIGACYDHMGRFDLSRRAYEQALAIAPGQPALYRALAGSLDADGLVVEAAAVRREAGGRLAESAAPVLTAAGSVAILPQAVQAVPAARSVTILLAPSRPAVTFRSGARLERLSSGEVALLTSSRSIWVALASARAPRQTVIRPARREALLVLNAARIAGLAARTRAYLSARGFAGSRIGDASATSAHTVIRFAPAERDRALRIAAQFPFATTIAVASGPLTLIVGRDAPTGLARRG